MTHTPSGQQAVDIEAALRWADRHEARERQKLRDMGLPPEGDMPVTGAFFVRGLVAMLRTAAPTAPSTAAGEREAIERDAARYRHLRAVAIRNDGGPSWPGPGVPAIAVPQDHHSGYFVNEEDADMHVDAAMEAAATAAALATPQEQAP